IFNSVGPHSHTLLSSTEAYPLLSSHGLADFFLVSQELAGKSPGQGSQGFSTYRSKACFIFTFRDLSPRDARVACSREVIGKEFWDLQPGKTEKQLPHIWFRDSNPRTVTA
ncbi:hypothetical protein GIB67_026748, partial [Kingdonia uniflora]